MDVHKFRAQVRGPELIEISRPRRWSEDEKLKIVLESLAGPRLVSVTARRHGVSRSLLTRWRREFRPERSEAGSATGFVPALIVPEPTPSSLRPDRQSARPREGRIEIVLGRGRSVIVDAAVDPDALGRVLDVLARR